MHDVARAVTAAVALLVGACGDDAGATVTVFAAASLTDAFEDVATAFEAANPGTTVQLNVAGSSSLREQILAGAPADVFASADASNMDQVVAGGAATGPVPFASNRLEVVVPAGNPAGVTGLADFADEGLLLGVCAAAVPCGARAREALAAAGVTAAVDTEEPDVRSLLTKVAAGELDAGIVYVTDVQAAGGDVEGIAIPADQNVASTYPIAVLRAARPAGLAQGFVAFVVSEEGQAVLAAHGFGAP